MLRNATIRPWLIAALIAGAAWAAPATAQRNDAERFVDAAKVLEIFTTD